jgi:ABC-type antimicrobial peptide transport system permease subunit
MPMFSYQFAPVLLEGQQLLTGQTGSAVWANSVDDRFFDTMGIDLVRGRAFAPTDVEGAPAVAIVNETLARHYWPDANPIGKRLQVLDEGRLVEIVGVVKTTKLGFPGELPQEGIYFPFWQRPRAQMVLIVHTEAESAAVLQPIRDLIHGMDADVPVSDVQTVEQFIDRKVTSFGNVMVRLIGGMGLMGMGLTMLGLYGLVSYAVSRRTREIGIRIAIGATYSRILRMVLHEGLTPAYFGVVLGFALSVATARWLQTLVPFSHHVDGATYSFVVPLILATTVLAAFMPARRAARINPTTALRYE